MRLAHLADLHLGFRQFWRETEGCNAREVDVATALRRTIDDLLITRPDVVVIAGDLMHSARPRSSPIMLLFNQLTRLRQALPDTRIVIVAGNHDTHRTMEINQAGCILPIYEHLGADVAVQEPKLIQLPGGLAITAVPHAAASRITKPDPAAEVNVLVVHGDVPGLGDWEPPMKDRVDPDELERMGWDYVALGHYHVCREVGPRMWYSGSIEYTSTNPWGELREQHERGVPGKGYLLVDLPDGEPVFRPIGPTRRFVDLAPIEGTDKGAAELDAEIASRMAETAIDDEVIRLVVREVRRDVKTALNYRQIRSWQGRALNMQLELRRCEAERATPAARAAMHRPLEEVLAESLRARPLDPAIDRTAFVERGLAAFAEVGLDPKRDPYTNELVPGL